jgi:pilus assembly protein Flp/PilA
MRSYLAALRSFLRDDDGAALIEYTTLIGILVLAVIATAIAVGIWVSGQWTTVNGLLP